MTDSNFNTDEMPKAIDSAPFIRQAFILAAGEGRRMRPLTNDCPKPLLKVGDKCLIELHIERLVAAGITDIVINVAYLAEQIIQHLGDGQRYGANIRYSHEDKPLETGGGLYKALPLMAGAPFVLVNGDVWTDLDFAQLVRRREVADQVASGASFLFLVENPEHNRNGDFHLSVSGASQEAPAFGLLDQDAAPRLTYSGVSVLHPHTIRDYSQAREVFPLLEVFRAQMAKRLLLGECHIGDWIDVGTPERLQALRARLSA